MKIILTLIAGALPALAADGKPTGYTPGGDPFRQKDYNCALGY